MFKVEHDLYKQFVNLYVSGVKYEIIFRKLQSTRSLLVVDKEMFCDSSVNTTTLMYLLFVKYCNVIGLLYVSV